MAEWPVPLAHLLLAQILADLGNTEAAREHCERVLEFPNLDTSHRDARSQIESL